MGERTRLSSLILVHWKSYRPSMVAELLRQNQLDSRLEAAEARVTDTLFSLITDFHMDYRQAWEEAMYQELLPEE